MNSEFQPTPEQEQEARITALLLGELHEAEAAALLQEIADNTELMALYNRLKQTIGLVEEATASPLPAELAAPEGLKLSSEKRDQLLAAFKTAQPEFTESKGSFRSWLGLAAMIVALFVFAGLLLPATAKSKRKARTAFYAAAPAAESNDRSGGSDPSNPQVRYVENVPLGDADQLADKNLAQLRAPVQVAREDLAKKKSPESDVSGVKIELPKFLEEQEVRRGDAAGKVDFFFAENGRQNNEWAASAGQAGGFGGAGGAAGAANYGNVATRGFAETQTGLAARSPSESKVSLGFEPVATPAPALVAATPPAATAATVADSLAVVEQSVKAGEAVDVAKRSLDRSESMGQRLSETAAAAESRSYSVRTRGAVTDQEVAAEKAALPAEMPAKGVAAKPLQPQTPQQSAQNFNQPAARSPLPMMPMPGVGGDARYARRPAPNTPLVLAPKAPPAKELKDVKALPSLREADRSAPMGAAGGQMGMMYYMQNPELMKRYFPQLYEQMRKSGELDKAAAAKSEVAQVKNEPAPEVGLTLERVKEVEELKAVGKPVSVASTPQPEVSTAETNFSTFSLNVSDVSYKLAAASLEKGQMPEPASIRSEEFINAFDYRDPAPVGSAPLGFAWERARYPFAHNRDLLRFSVKTAASGREAGRPLNLVLLLDNSGSMERADRVRIIQECMRVLATQLQAQDKVSVVTFARTARLWVDGLPGSSASELPTRVGSLTPEGGTNLEEAMRVAYETAARHFLTNGVNRVVLLTDGAANLGEVKPESLKAKVEEKRKAGIALDCFGIGWEGLNDDLLEQLSRNGDGRYGFVNTPEAASTEFASQLAGALKVAASDVKVQVEFNPKRTTTYRQIGYAKHQLTKEQFRDNTVDAAEIGAAEAGNALYVVQVNPAGEGPIATVRARFKIPGTSDYREHEWVVPFEGGARPLEQSTPAMRLAASASAFSEWLSGSPYAAEVTPDALLKLISRVSESFANDGRPKQLEWMIRQAKSIAGK